MINQIINDDCFQVMLDLEPKSVDLIVTSPPYNVGMEYEKTVDPEDYGEWIYDIGRMMKKVLKPDGRICWNVPYQMQVKLKGKVIIFSNWFLSFSAFRFAGLKFRDNITWNQINSDNDTAWGSWKSASSPWLRHQTEAIMIWYNEVWKKQNRGTDTIGRDEFLRDVIDLWKIRTESRRLHPAPFPIELAQRCIELFSFKDDVVLDPFCGSGTTCVAAKQLGRKYIGIDKEEKYCKIAKDRLKQEFLF